MSATTIKLEPDLVKKVTALKLKDVSISAFVRDLIEKEHRARANRAAVVYQQFLIENPEERAAMEVWESAPLVDEVESKKPDLFNRQFTLMNAYPEADDRWASVSTPTRLSPIWKSATTPRQVAGKRAAFCISADERKLAVNLPERSP